MTHEARLARMRRDGTTGIVDYITIGPEEDAALAAGVEALRLLPLALAGDLCRGCDCGHPDCLSVRALLATEVTR